MKRKLFSRSQCHTGVVNLTRERFDGRQQKGDMQFNSTRQSLFCLETLPPLLVVFSLAGQTLYLTANAMKKGLAKLTKQFPFVCTEHAY